MNVEGHIPEGLTAMYLRTVWEQAPIPGLLRKYGSFTLDYIDCDQNTTKYKKVALDHHNQLILGLHMKRNTKSQQQLVDGQLVIVEIPYYEYELMIWKWDPVNHKVESNLGVVDYNYFPFDEGENSAISLNLKINGNLTRRRRFNQYSAEIDIIICERPNQPLYSIIKVYQGDYLPQNSDAKFSI